MGEINNCDLVKLTSPASSGILEQMDSAGPSSGTVSWQPEPHVRGTSQILASCLLTLSLCVWNALHLNVVSTSKEVGELTLLNTVLMSNTPVRRRLNAV